MFKVKNYAVILKSSYFCIAVFATVFIFTFILRVHSYERTPPIGHLEEMNYAWSGIHLIETGIPVSWSTLNYPSRAEVFRGEKSLGGSAPFVYVRLYKPWLDEPPVFSLIVGFFAHIYHANRDDIIPSAYIRIPTVIFASFTSIFVFLIARFISGYWTGILAMLVYGVTPIMVLGSRLAVPENLITLLYAIMFFLLLKFLRKPRFLYLLPVPLLVGIAGLSKPTGFFLLPLALYIAFVRKSYDGLLYLIFLTLPFVILFFAYGIYYDPEIFWKITAIQSTRPAGFSSLAWFFISPAYDITSITDSWYVFALLSSAYFIFLSENTIKRWVSFAFIYWVMVVMVSGGERDLLPWYRFPAFPFLAILAAWGLQTLVIKANLFTSFLAAGMLLGSKFLLTTPFHQNISSLGYRLTLVILMVPSLFKTLYQRKWLERLCRLVIIGVIIVGVYFNTLYIYNVFDLSCHSVDCPLGPTTGLSRIHFPLVWRFLTTKESGD